MLTAVCSSESKRQGGSQFWWAAWQEWEPQAHPSVSTHIRRDLEATGSGNFSEWCREPRLLKGQQCPWEEVHSQGPPTPSSRCPFPDTAGPAPGFLCPPGHFADINTRQYKTPPAFQTFPHSHHISSPQTTEPLSETHSRRPPSPPFRIWVENATIQHVRERFLPLH